MLEQLTQILFPIMALIVRSQEQIPLSGSKAQLDGHWHCRLVAFHTNPD